MHIEQIDHLVLTVHSIAATEEFYTQVLGMTAITFGAGRHALAFGNQKINLHEAGREFEPKAHRPTSGSADLCFAMPGSSSETLNHLNRLGVIVEEGPVARTGARGLVTSVYIRDPDLNLIELAHYGG